MSRPNKDDNEKMSKVLPPIRCTEEEKSLIADKAKQTELSISEYVRRMALNGQIIIRQNRVDFEAVTQLKKIGININQQTAKLNATGKLTFELLDLNKKLEALIDKMMRNI